MTTLILTDLNGGDLMGQTLNEIASQTINDWPEMTGNQFKDAIRWYLCDPDDIKDMMSYTTQPVPQPCGDGHKHITNTFFLQSPVIEQLDQPLNVNTIIFID